MRIYTQESPRIFPVMQRLELDGNSCLTHSGVRHDTQLSGTLRIHGREREHILAGNKRP